MLALAHSALNERYHETWDHACYYDGHGHIELTSYGEWLCQLAGRPLLWEFCPWADSDLTDREVDRLLQFLCSMPPPPPEQLTLF